MAKPRIFVSSTFYDLQHIRENLENFITGYGYEPVLFESGDIPFTPDKELDHSCYREIPNCSMMILIIGHRYGSPVTDESLGDPNDLYEFYTSITKKELETAISEGIPCYIFVNNNVLSEFQTYKKNTDNQNINYAHVDNVSIFRLLNDLYSSSKNHITGFTKFEHISEWLRSQWAGEFEEYLSSLKANKTQQKIQDSIKGLEKTVANLNLVSTTLFDELIKDEDKIDDLRKKQEETKQDVRDQKIKDLTYNSHLIYRHAFTVEDIITAQKNSSDLSELEVNLKKAKPDCQCGYLNLVNNVRVSTYIVDINHTRDLLGLDLLSI